MNTALALTECEAPYIAAAAGQGQKAETGTDTAESITNSFKKKLQDCEAVMTPLLQTAGSSTKETDEGIQEDPGMVSGFSGICCILEMPDNPSRVIQGLVETSVMPAAATITRDAAAQEMSGTDGQQPDGMPKTIAWMQNTTAGETPVKTQDDILKAVGACLDAADTGAENNGMQTRTIQAAHTDAPNRQAQTVAAAQAEVQAASSVPDASQGRTQTGAAGQQHGLSGKGVSQGMPESGIGQKVIALETAGECGYTAAAITDSDEAAATQRQEAGSRDDIPGGAGKPQTAGVQTTYTGGMPSAPCGAARAGAAEVKAGELKVFESVYTKENVLRIVDKVSTQAKDGRYDFDVELKPDFLGKVSIKLTMKDGSIRMQIKTDDASVKGMLSDQTYSLQSALKEKGITLSSIDVTYDSQTSLSGDRLPFGQSGGDSRQSAYYAQTEATGFEPAAEPYSYYIGNSSVEFLA